MSIDRCGASEMQTLPTSPFYGNRWETDAEHLIWLPPEFADWEGPKSVYITGTRGSGKTTLLRAFEWDERLHNRSLKTQAGPDPLSKRYIGIYLNIPNYVTKRFERWPKDRDLFSSLEMDEERARLYCLYLEYQCLQLLTRAIQSLRGERILQYSPDQEHEAVREVLEERPEISRFLPNRPTERTLTDVRLAFKAMHERIRACAIAGNELTPADGFPALGMGVGLDEVSSYLLALCAKSSNQEDSRASGERRDWSLKVCLDQCESLNPNQQKALNTIVARLHGRPVSFVIAYLRRPYDISSTFIPNHPLTDADRTHFPLDQWGPQRFHLFVSEVSRLRFRAYLDREDITANLREILGELDINALLLPAVKRSESESVRTLLHEAERNRDLPIFQSRRASALLPERQVSFPEAYEEEEEEAFLPQGETEEVPPIYQTYLARKLKLQLPAENAEPIAVRRQKSREIRKKMVASMLCLCREYGIPVPYAGYFMVMSMSDQCIRDYLRQMHEIYIQARRDASTFLAGRIPATVQDRALRNASDDRRRGVADIAVVHPSQVMLLIDSLGDITAAIQSAHTDESALKSSERGVFAVRMDSVSGTGKREELARVLTEARDCHYIKVTREADLPDKWVFRLHRLFAPHYGFSYRGAFYVVPIEGETLYQLCSEQRQLNRKRLIEQIVAEITRAPGAPRLFQDEE